MYYFLLPLLLLFPVLVFAQNYTLMAPMGSVLSGSPDLTTYLRGAVTVIIGMAGLLAMIMLVICGIRLMGTPSASAKSAAKECIWNAVFGVLLALGAWVLLYTINPLLLSNELKLGDVALAPSTAGVTTPPPGIYQWSAGSSCAPSTGKIVAVVPPSYCSGSAPSLDSVCCGYVTSPLPPRTGSPVTTPGGPSDPTPPVDPSPSGTPVAFSASNYTVNEGAGTLTITVARSSGVGAGTIDYFTSESGASEGTDYRNTSGTLTFADGVLTKTFMVSIIDDTVVEGSQDFLVALSNPTGVIDFGAVGSAVVRITDNDTSATPDTTSPTVIITSPASNLATSSATIRVTFTASDDVWIKRIEYTVTPPSPATAQTVAICNTDCDNSPITMTVPVPIRTDIAGTHTIAIRACDSAQCYAKQISLIIEAPCVDTNIVTCKVLPTGNTEAPWCTPDDGTSGLSVLGENVLSEAWCLPDTYNPDHDPVLHPELEGIYTSGTTTGQCFPAAWVNSPKVHAYEFKIVTDSGGGDVFIAGGSQQEWPPHFYADDSTCDGIDQCDYYSDYYYCWPNVVPNNLIVSISSTPGDMTSTPTTEYTQSKRLSGNCGTGNAVNIDRFATKILTTSGTGICKVEKERTYYLNVTAIPFIAGGNVLYSLFWDFVP